MEDSRGGRFPGHTQNRLDSSRPLRVSFPLLYEQYVLHFAGPAFREVWWQSTREQTPCNQLEGRGRGAHPITPQAIAVNQEQFFTPSVPLPPPYTNPGINPDGFFTRPLKVPHRILLPPPAASPRKLLLFSHNRPR